MNDRATVITLSLLIVVLSTIVTVMVSANVALAITPSAQCYDNEVEADEYNKTAIIILAFAEAGATIYGTNPLTSYGVVYGSAWLTHHPLVVWACWNYFTQIRYITGLGYWEWIDGDTNISMYRNIPPGEMGDFAAVSSGVYCGSITNPYIDAGVIAYIDGYCGT